MQLHDERIQPGEKVEPLASDACAYKAPVFSLAPADDESGILETVQQPGDVGNPRDEAVTHLVAAESSGAGAAQDPERIVLSGG
jgi:hypothetical protein